MKVIQKDFDNERIFDVYVKAVEQHKKLSNIRDFLHTLKVKKQKEVQHSCMLQLRLRKYGLNASCMNSRNDLSLRELLSYEKSCERNFNGYYDN